MTAITLQGHDRHGWDTETIESMEDVRAYLEHTHTEPITVYIGDRTYALPMGIGRRCA